MPKILTKEHGNELALKNGGICLQAGKNSRDNWKWKCLCGNEWQAIYCQIRDGSWCPSCRKNKVTIDKLKEHAFNLGGKCLSSECKNIFTKVTWQCKYDHIWDAMPSNVFYKNKWCPFCSKNKKLTIEHAKQIAKNRNAILLSTEYVNSGSKLKWKCEGGHEFEMSMNSIRNRGHWCPYCNSWNSEEICRFVFENVFECSFVKCRPKWLINENNNVLELDGYSDKTFNGKYIAFEHNGLQHYVDNYLPSNLNKLQKHDNIKRKLCIENNVVLFVIPHLFKMTKLQDLIPEIKKQAVQNGLNIDACNFNVSDLSSVYLLNNKLKRYESIISGKGGKLLSKFYTNSQNKLKICCSEGHEFQTSGNSLQQGSWCPYCSGNSKLTLEEMQKLAERNNGKCLSNEYINARTKLIWECSCKNIWKARPYSIKSGSWCPKCARRKR